MKIQDLLNQNRNVWTEPGLIVAILKKIIFSGQMLQDEQQNDQEHQHKGEVPDIRPPQRYPQRNDKFLLIGFPDQIDHVEIFERECANIRAIIYTSAQGQPTVEIKGDDLSLKNIDTLFSKEFRLKPMRQWDAWTFEERLGSKITWGFVYGRKLSGKTTVSNEIASILKGKVINMESVREEMKKSDNPEEEDAEGKPEPSLGDIEHRICEMIAHDQRISKRFTYVFDGWLHETAPQFFTFMYNRFGHPEFAVDCQAQDAVILDRFKKVNEIAENLDEG